MVAPLRRVKPDLQCIFVGERNGAITGVFVAGISRDMASERTYTDQEVALILRRAMAAMCAPRAVPPEGSP